jgi:ABC-type bacteriocin/lantibiotic exporter with double-glycine peptidase domain
MKNFFLFLKQFDKRNYYLIIFFGITSAFLELLGLGLLFPVFNIILGTEESEFFFFLKNNFFESYKEQDLLGIILKFLALVYICKFFISLIITYFSNLIKQNIKVIMQQKILNKFFYRKYLDHGKDSIAVQIKNLTSEAESSLIVIETFFLFIIEVLILLTIIIFLIINFFKMTMIMLTLFSILFLLFFFIFAKKIKYFGDKRIYEEESFFKNVFESLSIFKEIKFYNKESFFLKKIYKNMTEIKKTSIFNGVLNGITKNLLELLILLMLIFFLYYVKYILNYENSTIISTIGIFLVTSARLLPSISKIFFYFQNTRFRNRSVQIILKIFNEVEDDKNKIKDRKIFFTTSIDLRNVHFGYLNRKKLFKNLNLKIAKADCLGVIGSNGSGKSTLLDLITGVLEPQNGEVLVDNINIKDNIAGWQQSILYLSQKNHLFEDTILANIILGDSASNYDLKKFENALEISNLKNFLDKLENKDQTQIGSNNKNLSGGQQKKIHIARCFYQLNDEKKLLILDEPFENLDENTKSIFIKNLKKIKNQYTIIIISHNNKDLEICNKIYNLMSEELTYKN